ncbi:hypothetical protein Ancab_035543 [Ancistrocladus abbreviatus]
MLVAPPLLTLDSGGNHLLLVNVSYFLFVLYAISASSGPSLILYSFTHVSDVSSVGSALSMQGERREQAVERQVITLDASFVHTIPTICSHNIHHDISFSSFIRMSKKGDEVVADLLRDLQYERDMCKSLEVKASTGIPH